MFESYNVLLITIFLLLFYGFSLFLVKKGKISILKHKRFWNVLLMINFLTSAILGILLAVLIDQKIYFSGYRKLLWLHVEFGIGMALVAVFHFLWHWRYFFPKKVTDK